MKPTRRTQPLRKALKQRQQTMALDAAQKGAMVNGYNPQDSKRRLQKPRATINPVTPMPTRTGGGGPVPKPKVSGTRAPVEVNRTGNARSGQSFRTTVENGREVHVYANGKRVTLPAGVGDAAKGSKRRSLGKRMRAREQQQIKRVERQVGRAKRDKRFGTTTTRKFL